MQQPNLDFYWIAGVPQTVQVVATVRGTRLTAQVTHNVLAPTSVSMTSKTAHVEVGDPGAIANPPALTPPYLFYGVDISVNLANNLKNPMGSWQFGINLSCEATAPLGGDGEIAVTQLVQFDLEKTPNSGPTQTASSNGTFWLDTQVPYANPDPITAGNRAICSNGDVPTMQLIATLRKASVKDFFRTYFMYKPAGADSIWVTLMRLDWHWAGETTRVGAPAGTGNKWNRPANIDNGPPNPSGRVMTELPIWDYTIDPKNVTWVIKP